MDFIINLLTFVGTVAFWTFIVSLIINYRNKKRSKDTSKTKKVRNYSLITFLVSGVIAVIGGGISSADELKVSVYDNVDKEKVDKIEKNVWSADTNHHNVVVLTIKTNQDAKLSYKADENVKVQSMNKIGKNKYKLSAKIDGMGDIYIKARYKDQVVKRDIFAKSYDTQKDEEKQEEKDESSESSKAESSSDMKKAESNNAKTKKSIFIAGVYNLPNSTKGVVSNAKYENNMVTITVSDDALSSASDDDLKSFCFNMYRTINGEAKKDGLALASITINDEQGDTLAETKTFGGFKYYGMGN